jgi:hypothetical protein
MACDQACSIVEVELARGSSPPSDGTTLMLPVGLYDNCVYLGFDSFVRGEPNRHDAESMR